jgi:general stress protein 26
MAEVKHSPEAIRRFNELVHDIKFAMLTTEHADGYLRSRPMATQEADGDGNLWFFTGLSSSKVDEIRQHRQVNVCYANPEKQSYVSVNGTAELSREREKMTSLWNPLYRAYFPKGLDDPDLALIKVHINEVEFWDSSSSRMVRMAGWVKALVTGDRSAMGEHDKIA